MEITVGMKGTATTTVNETNTASAMCSGCLPVFATPCMVALMEAAARDAIAQAIPEGKSTVGTEISVRHVSASPVGMEIRAEAQVTAVEGKITEFRVCAYDQAGLIGEGTHKRATITVQRFLERAQEKL